VKGGITEGECMVVSIPMGEGRGVQVAYCFVFCLAQWGIYATSSLGVLLYCFVLPSIHPSIHPSSSNRGFAAAGSQVNYHCFPPPSATNLCV